MTVQDGIVYKGGQAVVPKELRKEFLQLLHSSHQGSQLTLRGARDDVYWPGMALGLLLTVLCVRRIHQLNLKSLSCLIVFQRNHGRKLAWTFFVGKGRTT